MNFALRIVLCLLAAATWTIATAAPPRPLPSAQPHHPGNVFLEGESVVLPVPADDATTWRLLEYDERELTSARAHGGTLDLGRLPVGFYRLKSPSHTNWISCAVLSALRAPTPASSPVAIDVAMAWFYPREKMADVSSLCALAGVNWVRDRLTWGQMETAPGKWSEPNHYDASAEAQTKAGLRVLQVIHLSPPWANPKTSRFPLDLRDAYRFNRQIGLRWKDQVLAFEPWNEADIPMFGGHTGSEMATLQKASYLGLKAGNPDMIACLNVFALPNRSQLADLHANQAWPYFDRFDLHHYVPFDAYPGVYEAFRNVAGGRPLWVTECALPVKWSGNEKLQEPVDADLRVQAERVAKTFACSLHEGSAATFYFMLPHYVEGQTQFGLLRPDLTPRPGYVALAAVGRLLADAQPLGRLRGVPETVRAFLFRARPDGRESRVLVAWTIEGEARLPVSGPVASVFDHLGRVKPLTDALTLSPAPIFVLLPEGSARQLELQAPPGTPARAPGEASPVVIQALWPEDKIVLSRSAYRLSSQNPESVPLYVYNFSDTPVTGRLEVAVPPGWRASSFEAVQIAPQSRAELRLELDCRNGEPRSLETVRVTGDFGRAGRPVLSLRITPEPNLLGRQAGITIPGAEDASLWQTTISGGNSKIISKAGAVSVQAEPESADKWVYPVLPLKPAQRPPEGITALAFTLNLEEGEGTFRALFEEENGSTYVVDLLAQPKPGETVDAVALFESAVIGAGWSKPDPNGRFDPDHIVAVKLGCNTRSSAVKFSFKDLRWVKEAGPKDGF